MANPKNGSSSTALATVDAAIDRQVKYGSICLRETPGRIKSTVSLGNVKNNRLVACTFGGGPGLTALPVVRILARAASMAGYKNRSDFYSCRTTLSVSQ